MVTHTGFKLQTYPNGEFTLGYTPPNKFTPDPMQKPKELSSRAQIMLHDPGFAKWKCEIIREKIESDSIDLSIPPNSHKRGLNGITSYGARTVRNAAYLLQERFGRQNLSFVTLTVPSVTRDEQKAIASQWSSIVRKYHQELKRELIRCGVPGLYVSVTEIQPRRFKKRGELGLHLHVCHPGRRHRYDDWAISPCFHRQVWGRILRGILGRDFDDRALENVQGVRKDAEGYLGKYMSKGSKIVGKVAEEFGEEVIPSSWWSCELSLRRAIAHLVSRSWEMGEELFDELPGMDDSGALKWIRLHSIMIHGREFCVGASGKWDKNVLAISHPSYYNLIKHY